MTWPGRNGGVGSASSTRPHRRSSTICVATGHLESDHGMLFIGPEAEMRFGRRNFMDLLSVFAASPEFKVLLGREEIGSVDPIVLTRKVDGPRLIVLAGRSWQVTHIDWKRRRCFVEPDEDTGRRCGGSAKAYRCRFALSRAMRDVLLGHDPEVTLSRRAVEGLAGLRGARRTEVHAGRHRRSSARARTTGGGPGRAPAPTPPSWQRCPDVIDPKQQVGNYRLRLLPASEERPSPVAGHRRGGTSWSPLQYRPSRARAVSGLKFNEVLPAGLAAETLALRMVDRAGAAAVAAEPRVVVIQGRRWLSSTRSSWSSSAIARSGRARPDRSAPRSRSGSAARFAEECGCRWFVLSAHHGVLAPDEWVTPRAEVDGLPSGRHWRAWADWVAAQLDQRLQDAGGLSGVQSRRAC